MLFIIIFTTVFKYNFRGDENKIDKNGRRPISDLASSPLPVRPGNRIILNDHLLLLHRATAKEP
jgi:hypothetical protein